MIDKKHYKKYLIIQLLGGLIVAIYFIVDYDGGIYNADIELEERPAEWRIYLKEMEFSTVLYCDGFIYAGGVGGLFRINPQTGEYIEVKDIGKSYSMVRALHYQREVGLWVGHEEGITVVNDGKNLHINNKTGLLNPRIIDFLQVDEQTIYAATFEGIAEIKEMKVNGYISQDSFLPGDIIRTMFKDSRGWIWLGSYNSRGGSGVACIKDGKEQLFNVKNGLVHNNITAIVETEDKHIIVGGGLYTSGGANVFEYIDNKWVIVDTIKQVNGLAGAKIRNIYIDRWENIWFCSEYDGIAIFKPDGKVVKLTEKGGLSDNEVKKITIDNSGNLWLATQRGITFINEEWHAKNLQQ